MKNVKTIHNTRTVGESQGYLPLHIADDVTEDQIPAMVTFWQPSPEEIQALQDGKFIRLVILGTMHPPLRLDVYADTLETLTERVS